MSAYITLATPMLDQECLLQALGDMGFSAAKVEVHEEPVALVGYEGSQRAQKANLVIRRQNVGSASNDLGFVRTETGFRAIISDYDRRKYGSAWLGKLGEHYDRREAAKRERLEAAERRRLEEERRKLVEAQREAIIAKAKKMKYRVKEERVGDTVRLVLAKRIY